MRITHLVCTDNFAGVERHIAVLAAAQHDAGHEVTVLGGQTDSMRRTIARPGVTVLPAGGMFETLRHLTGPAGRRADVIATHMTAADSAVIAVPAPLRAPIVSTRHFAARRGTSLAVRTVAELTQPHIGAEIAVSDFVARAIGIDSTVVLPGILDRHSDGSPSTRGRTILMAQRLETEKATDVALRAFAVSGLGEQGWTLQIAGAGADRDRLATLADELGIGQVTHLLGYRNDVDDLMSRAAMFMATATAEPMGLSVLEAMANGLPVVATAAGGHLESVGGVPEAALFTPGDVMGAARLLKELANDPERLDVYGAALRERQRSAFSITAQAASTDEVYRYAIASRRRLPQPAEATVRGLVVVSLEPWDHVWRRNQHLVAGLLRSGPGLRVLFVEPAVDPLHTVRSGSTARRARGMRRGPQLSGVDPDALWLLEPVKILPRRIDTHQDQRWAQHVQRAARRLGMQQPRLWVNDPLGADLMAATGWATLYDITDDWLAADRDAATLARLRRQEHTLMRGAREVIVCSTGLQLAKSRQRPVTLLHNAVDADTIRAAPRPADLPDRATAVYVGTLHSDRLDVELCAHTATTLGESATVVLVGPDALTSEERGLLDRAGVLRLGAKDRREVPGYLQHADVLLVPHVVDDFTDSLDPIKLYEYRAVGRVTISTPVAGFRDAASDRMRVADRKDFARAVATALPAQDRFPTGADLSVPSWAARVDEMRAAIERIAIADQGTGPVPLAARVRMGHAAVQFIADRQGLHVLHIKGDALEPSLMHADRITSDVDVLVRPDDVQAFLVALEEEGFVRKGRFTTSSPFEHSVTLTHELWGHIDVHRLYPGFGLPPDRAFELLWERRHEMEIAGYRCPVPQVAAQALLLILHAARNVPGGQPSRDVEHVWAQAGPESRAMITDVVDTLDAHIAFAVGIGESAGLPPSPERDLWQAVSDPDGRLHEWRSRIAAAPSPGARLRLVARASLVNTDHLAAALGRDPTRREIVAEFFDRLRRAASELRRAR